ncbi:hypothetical protein PLICRDRAFT_42602 [Plicaturopsis crispa FD-325 SS-3]|nr:hypothetical protein PLICRDRAFT_42602 [Plicaturopsis crispa FD-325 SS-3]
MNPELKRDQSIEPAVVRLPSACGDVIVWLVATLLCDVLIAGCLSHFFRTARAQTAFSATKTFLTKLLVLSVQSGLVTALAAGAQLVTFMLGSLVVSNYWDHGLAIVLGKLYSNMLLASLNARTVVARITDGQADLKFTVEMKSHQGIAFRVEFTEVGETPTGIAAQSTSRGVDTVVTIGDRV